MASIDDARFGHRIAGLFDRDRIVAGPGFNRWLMPPAALGLHLSIGMAYGFSVFWLPLSQAIGIERPVVCPDLSLAAALVTTACDWRVSDLAWLYALFFVFLGSSAALWGGWHERGGPRRTGAVAALCWCGGLLISALGVATHQLWLIWLGSGAIGGVGIGLAYISPVALLVKWFPDRRGMATGMALMGFGGGAMIGAPLADLLMDFYATPASVGVWETFATLAAIHFAAMLVGAFAYRLPPPNWRPDGWMPPRDGGAPVAARDVHLKDAHRTPQFWCLWAVLFVHVNIGIGVIGMASPMVQEIFAGALIGRPELNYDALNEAQHRAVAAIAAGFTGLLSLFNIAGRVFWAALSDHIGRRNTYTAFFVLGCALYLVAPWAGQSGNRFLFVACFCIVLSVFGGGFSTLPAYVADLFGTRFVGAIHGRLLTAWSLAAVVGPALVTYLREFQLAAGVPRAQVYDVILYLLAALTLIGLAANLAIRPVAERWLRRAEAGNWPDRPAPRMPTSHGIGRGGLDRRAALAWTMVGAPMLWGLAATLQNTMLILR